jgi:hypothetical protein
MDPNLGRPPWSAQERRLLASLRRPIDVQRFLDALPYNEGHDARSPRRVMRDRKAHCFEGALFAAAALERQGLGCRVLDLAAVRDDDHVIALYQVGGHWGAVAKSNFTGLRYREPVYRTLRELVMSYFDGYFNTLRERTLRAYSRPVDLRRFDPIDWRTTEADLQDSIGEHLSLVAHRPVATARQIRSLHPVDTRSFDAAMLGANPDGLFRPS